MDLQFPKITHLNEVLPALEGQSSIKVTRKDNYIFVDYGLATRALFQGPYGAIRKECRGLIFDTEGRLISRPLHKFFNYHECLETRSLIKECIDHSRKRGFFQWPPCLSMRLKHDGSMIRPVLIEGKIRLCTRRGITVQSEMAESWLARSSVEVQKIFYEEFTHYLGRRCTPIYEFVHPENRIVVPYSRGDLKLLAIRENYTGQYLFSGSSATAADYLVENQDGTLLIDALDEVLYGDSLDDFLAYRSQKLDQWNLEGEVIYIRATPVAKVKTVGYCARHRLKSKINIASSRALLFLRGGLDDLSGILPEAEVTRMEDEHEGWLSGLTGFCEALLEAYEAARVLPDQKSKAMKVKEYAPLMAPYLFTFLKLPGVLTYPDIFDRVTEQLELFCSQGEAKYVEKVRPVLLWGKS